MFAPISRLQCVCTVAVALVVGLSSRYLVQMKMPIYRPLSIESSHDSERLGCCFSPLRRTVEYFSLNFALSIITDCHVIQLIVTSVVSTFIRFQFSSSPPFNCYMASISGSPFSVLLPPLVRERGRDDDPISGLRLRFPARPCFFCFPFCGGVIG